MKNAIIALVVVLVLGAGAFALTRNDSEPNTSTTNTTQTENETPSQSEQTLPADEAEESNSVSIQDFAFTPANITVKKGTTVTWTNNDSVVHTVTSSDGDLMDSGNMSQGDTYSVTFSEIGTFEYFCEPHPNMTGTVTVTE